MKDKNTLARVILWAVIVVILCGAFVGVLLRYRFGQANTEPAAEKAENSTVTISQRGDG